MVSDVNLDETQENDVDLFLAITYCMLIRFSLCFIYTVSCLVYTFPFSVLFSAPWEETGSVVPLRATSALLQRYLW